MTCDLLHLIVIVLIIYFFFRIWILYLNIYILIVIIDNDTFNDLPIDGFDTHFLLHVILANVVHIFTHIL